MKPKMNTQELTKIALCTALLCVSSYLSFPIPFTPIVITAQTLVVTLIGGCAFDCADQGEEGEHWKISALGGSAGDGGN